MKQKCSKCGIELLGFATFERLCIICDDKREIIIDDVIDDKKGLLKEMNKISRR